MKDYYFVQENPHLPKVLTLLFSWVIIVRPPFYEFRRELGIHFDFRNL